MEVRKPQIFCQFLSIYCVRADYVMVDYTRCPLGRVMAYEGPMGLYCGKMRIQEGGCEGAEGT